MKVLESIDSIASKVKILPIIHVIAVLLGIARYFACSMPSSTTQPICMGLFHLLSIHPLWMSYNYVWGGESRTTILMTYNGGLKTLLIVSGGI